MKVKVQYIYINLYIETHQRTFFSTFIKIFVTIDVIASVRIYNENKKKNPRNKLDRNRLVLSLEVYTRS